MNETNEYAAKCHCGAVRFRFQSEPFTRAIRCNCSICIRKGAIMSATYYPAERVVVEGLEALSLYRFGDGDVNHYFCKTCGVYPFHRVASVPADYDGPARVGDYRFNLACVDAIDALGLPIDVIDGRSFP